MRKYFNVTGLCTPDKHYMVDISRKLVQIQRLVDRGFYFTINRARQYGKTTTLVALEKTLADRYLVIRLDFQVLGSASFQNENTFSLAFASCFLKAVWIADKESAADSTALAELCKREGERDCGLDLRRLFQLLQNFCESLQKPVVLMIDEVDSAVNNQVFLDFLAQLRYYYLERAAQNSAAFHSVILAGVYDVKNLKRKLRGDEEHKTNSPWNIAADFDVDMSFDVDDIAGMLQAYESDVRTGMDIGKMAALLYEYTSGYPFLVSRLCMMMDEKLGKESGFASEKEVWTKEGFLAAVRMLLMEKNTLFESLLDKMEAYPSLKQMLRELLFAGKEISYNALDPSIALALMFGFVKKQNHAVVPANRIFDTLLYNFFLSQQETQGEEISLASQKDKNQFVLGEKTLIEAVV